MAMATQCPSPDFDFSSEELQVAQILLEFPLLVQKSEFSLGLSPAWPRKRNRSALDSPSPSPSAAMPPPPPPPPPPPKEVQELSPTSPLFLNSLALSPSESDEITNNAKRSKNKPSLNKKTQYMEAIDELTKRKQVLEGEVEAVKRRYNHLKAINSELKAKKQEVILAFKNESVKQEIGSSSSAMEIVQLTVKSPSPTLENHHHLHFQPSIKNQTATPTPEPINQSYQIPIGNIPSYDTSLGPMGIPDLNISLEELTQRNYSKFMAARARRNRIQICKTKNSNNAATKLQSPNPCR